MVSGNRHGWDCRTATTHIPLAEDKQPCDTIVSMRLSMFLLAGRVVGRFSKVCEIVIAHWNHRAGVFIPRATRYLHLSRDQFGRSACPQQKKNRSLHRFQWACLFFTLWTICGTTRPVAISRCTGTSGGPGTISLCSNGLLSILLFIPKRCLRRGQ